jgi:aminopeptidase N
MKTGLILVAAGLIFGACQEPKQTNSESKNIQENMENSHRPDPHSFTQEARVNHLDLDLEVHFEEKKISGTADYTVESNGADKLYLDIDGVDIRKVSWKSPEGIRDLKFSLSAEEEFLGQALIIDLPKTAKKITVDYSTREGAKALQWLDAQQTAGKQFPFLFTQSQAILARTWMPVQDGPGFRFSYKAKVKVPQGMMALMSASNPTAVSPDGIYTFEMNQAVPAYLMAMSVGKLEFRSLGDRTGIYAEAELIDKAAYEFAKTEDMLEAAEKIYGPYSWERYDMIVLPPSFPFGGMENPRLTFVTPTILAGDRSLTALIAHELAHSWSGNLVTNATWDDFWLNEGFTVYFERRIMEEISDVPYANMLALLGHQDLVSEVDDLGNESEDTHLKLHLEGRNPDDGMTDIAYEKGYFLLRLIEEHVGRNKFDAFLKAYFKNNAFKTMTTESFLSLLKKDLLDEKSFKDLRIEEWVYGAGIPDNCPKVVSDKFELVEAELKKFIKNGDATKIDSKNWTSHEWLHFIRHINDKIDLKKMKSLDAAFNFTNSGNAEIQAAWFEHTIEKGYSSADASVEEFLVRVGRRKFLMPLYKSLLKADPSGAKAKAIYKKARANYHAVSQESIDELLK